MAKRTTLGHRGAKGQRGIRGLTGPAGPAGPIGHRGKVGKVGKVGRKGAASLREPLQKADVFPRLMNYFDDVYQQLGLHMKRLAEMQYQVDEFRAQLKTFDGNPQPTPPGRP